MSARTIPAVRCAVMAIAVSGPLPAQEEDRLAGFEPFLGRWRPGAAVLEQRPQLAGIDAEVYARGPYGNTIRLFEFVDTSDPNQTTFEGFAYWHPQADEIRFSGYNARNLFYLEGRYEHGSTTLTRTMTVHYPDGMEFSSFPEVTGRTRQFREVRTLTAPDTMELVIYMMVQGAWRRWPNDDAAPFVLVRAS